jgi:uncharacterized YccA/Bax inhibitor family protein
MRFINSKFHAVVDYASGGLMLFVSSLASSDGSPAARWIALIAGISALVVSMLTIYEGGIIGVVPLYVHLVIDIIWGVALIVSCFVFVIAGPIKDFFLVMGVIAIIFGLCTHLRPTYQRSY